jgi:hypothetical protein
MNIDQWVSGTQHALKTCLAIGSRMLELLGRYHEASGQIEDISRARHEAQLRERLTKE